MYFLDSASNRKYSSFADNSVRDERRQGMVKKRREDHKAKKRPPDSETIQSAGNADEFDAAGGEAPTKKKRRKRQKSTEQPAAIARVADDGSQGSKNSDEPEAKKCGEVVAQAGRKKCNVVNASSDADQRGKSREEGAKTQPKSASASKRNARDDFDDAQSSDARGEAFKKTRNMEPLRHASAMREATDDAQPAGKSANREVEGILSIVKKFASVWLPSKLYDFLLEAASELTVRGSPTLRHDVDKFHAAFARGGNNAEELQEFLFKLRRLRVTFGGDLTRLSEEKTTDCIWAFARGFILKPETLRLSKRKQRSRLSCVLDAQYIRYHRLRALIKTGLHRFENVLPSRECSVAERRERWEAMLNCFLDYIVDVETCAARYKEEGWCIYEETNRAPAVSTRMHDDRKSCAPQWDSGHASKSQASGGSWQPSQWSSVSWQSKIPASGGYWQWQPNTWLSKEWQGKIPAWRHKTAGKLQKNDEMQDDEESIDEEEAEKRRKRLERWKA